MYDYLKSFDLLKNQLINHHNMLDSKIDSKIESNDYDKIFNIIYLIDLENKPIFKKKLDKNILYIGFINSIHNSLIKYTDWNVSNSDNLFEEILKSKNNKQLYLIEGGISDLVDHFITLYMYPLINYLLLIKIIIKYK